ncbi:hypothetical protein [Cellulomonas sp. PSBB021]|uniref:hypothetical protein n=1 Tax=Cellulomonas sp. PSBB021 TaxID=2003551 RepID=UPI0012FDA737|nr:hypothetical protein [Cellulomonas sp. PSBB021]
MSSILLRTESASSSQIENPTVGARQLAVAEIDQAGSENTRLVAPTSALTCGTTRG